MTLESQLGEQAKGSSPARRMLAITLGVHAAVEDEVKSAWREALKGQNLELETLDIFGHGSFKYNQNQYYEQLAKAWEQVPLPGLEDVFQQLKFNYQGGISLDLVSVQGQVTRATAQFQSGGDAAFFFCGMPTLLCIAFFCSTATGGAYCPRTYHSADSSSQVCAQTLPTRLSEAGER